MCIVPVVPSFRWLVSMLQGPSLHRITAHACPSCCVDVHRDTMSLLDCRLQNLAPQMKAQTKAASRKYSRIASTQSPL